MTGWKRVLLASFGFGVGAAIAAACVIGLVTWYRTAPTPPKPWNRLAIRATEPPGFTTVGDDSHVWITFTLSNNTEHDYEVGKDQGGIKVMLRDTHDRLAGPLGASVDFHFPVFIPAGRKAELFLELTHLRLKRHPGEGDAAYHERLRGFLNSQEPGLGGYVLFDEQNRYEIVLPRWLDQPPKEQDLIEMK